jgi:hypothetical protein
MALGVRLPDEGLRPLTRYAARHEGWSSAPAPCAARSPASAPSRAVDPARFAKGAAHSPQLGNKLWRKPRLTCSDGGDSIQPTSGSFRSDRPRHGFGCAGVGPDHRWKAPRVQRTSGFFAEARGKRPWPRMCPRKRHVPAPALRARRKTVRTSRRRPRASGPSRARGICPSRGQGSRGEVVSGTAPDGAGAGHTGLSSRRGHGLMTRGVRADRVGVALPPFVPARVAGSEPSVAKAAGVSRWIRASARPAPGP